MEFLKKVKDHWHKPGLGAIIACASSGFVGAAIYTLAATPDFLNLSKSISAVSVGIFVLLFLLIGLGTFLPYAFTGLETIPAAVLTALSLLYACFVMGRADESAYLGLGVALIMLLILKWTTAKDRLRLDLINEKFKDPRILWGITAALFVIFTVSVAVTTSRKYSTFSNFTFDFGIFAQMFEYMRTTGLPLTTLERSTELTHFAVHFSPIFYLALPGYLIFHTPYYLFWIQAAVVGAGIFPVVGILRKLNQSPLVCTAGAVIYFAYPALANACFYDFHENKFLTVMILWMIYFIISDKTIPTLVFALLTLSVKEDAAMYVFAVALWMILTRPTRKQKIIGAGLFAMALGYFILATNLIRVFGGEIMMSRLGDYLLPGESGFGAVAKNVALDFSNFVSSLFTADKVAFVIWTLVCVMLLPFFGDALNLILITPMLLINLMQSWQYQYDIDYQYSYGVGALILVCSILALVKLKPEMKKVFLVGSVCLCLIFSSNLTYEKMGYYNARYQRSKETYALVEEALKKVPRDASVTATGDLTPHLYDVKELYSIPDYYGSPQFTDFYVIDTRYTSSNYDVSSICNAMNYDLIESAGFIEIWQLRSYVPASEESNP